MNEHGEGLCPACDTNAVGACTCDPQAYDLGPEGQRRYFEDRYCPTHGEEAMAVCMCSAIDADTGERSWRPCPSDICERPSHFALGRHQ